MMYTYTHEKDIEPRLEGLFTNKLVRSYLGNHSLDLISKDDEF